MYDKTQARVYCLCQLSLLSLSKKPFHTPANEYLALNIYQRMCSFNFLISHFSIELLTTEIMYQVF